MLPDPIEEFTEGGFTIYDDQGEVVEVKFCDLIRVSILTTDQGPFLPDFFYILETPDREVVVEQEDPASIILLHVLQQLPGFDNEAVIRASRCHEYECFLCWEKGPKI